jgi:hypothetical protein
MEQTERITASGSDGSVITTNGSFTATYGPGT